MAVLSRWTASFTCIVELVDKSHGVSLTELWHVVAEAWHGQYSRQGTGEIEQASEVVRLVETPDRQYSTLLA